MYKGKTRELAKIWSSIGGTQVSQVPANTDVTGDAPRSDGYVFLRTPRVGFTKTIWLTNYVEVVTPPPPPPPPPPTEVTLVHTIDIYSDGSITIDGNPYP